MLPLTAPFVAFFLFKHQNHVATPEKPKIIGKMANVPTAIIKRSPPVTTYFACVLYILFVFISFGVFLPSAHVQTDYAPDLAEKTVAYLDVFLRDITQRE